VTFFEVEQSLNKKKERKINKIYYYIFLFAFFPLNYIKIYQKQKRTTVIIIIIIIIIINFLFDIQEK
jgi:hypothetical protein